jgi:hypothetical protein
VDARVRLVEAAMREEAALNAGVERAAAAQEWAEVHAETVERMEAVLLENAELRRARDAAAAHVASLQRALDAARAAMQQAAVAIQHVQSGCAIAHAVQLLGLLGTENAALRAHLERERAAGAEANSQALALLAQVQQLQAQHAVLAATAAAASAAAPPAAFASPVTLAFAAAAATEADAECFDVPADSADSGAASRAGAAEAVAHDVAMLGAGSVDLDAELEGGADENDALHATTALLGSAAAVLDDFAALEAAAAVPPATSDVEDLPAAIAAPAAGNVRPKRLLKSYWAQARQDADMQSAPSSMVARDARQPLVQELSSLSGRPTEVFGAAARQEVFDDARASSGSSAPVGDTDENMAGTHDAAAGEDAPAGDDDYFSSAALDEAALAVPAVALFSASHATHTTAGLSAVEALQQSGAQLWMPEASATKLPEPPQVVVSSLVAASARKPPRPTLLAKLISKAVVSDGGAGRTGVTGL